MPASLTLEVFFPGPIDEPLPGRGDDLELLMVHLVHRPPIGPEMDHRELHSARFLLCPLFSFVLPEGPEVVAHVTHGVPLSA